MRIKIINNNYLTKGLYLLIFISLLLLFFSCSPRRIRWKKLFKQYERGEISINELNQKIYIYYSDTIRYKNDTLCKVKFKGTYVEHLNNGMFKLYKFNNKGHIYESAKLRKLPSFYIMRFASNSSKEYYISNFDKIEIERMWQEKFNVYNVIDYGNIVNDTIFINSYRSEQYPWFTGILNKKLIYDSTLIVELDLY